MSDKEEGRSRDELIDALSEGNKQILEQFRYDLEHQPIRQLNKKEREIWGYTVMNALEKLPSFRDALAVLSPYMDATSTTAYTDEYARVGLSYWFFYAADNNTRAIAILHESMHVLNSHFSRGANKGLKPRMMNIAGDLEINSNLSLLDGAKDILEDFLLPDNEKFGFPYYKTLEQYSTLLKDKLEEEREKSEQEDKSDSGDSGSQGDSSGGKSDSAGDSSDGEDSSSDSDGSGEGGSGQDGEGGSGEDNSSGTEGGSGSGNSESGSNPGSGYGNAYDSFVDDLLGRKKKGGSQSLEDMLSEKENGGKCDGNHTKGSGKPCDGSCNHEAEDSDEDNGDDGSGEGSNDKGSVKNVQRKNSSNANKVKVPKPIRSCDRNTQARSEAADKAGVDRSSVVEQNIARRNTRARVVEEVNNNKSRGTGSSNEFLKIVSAFMTPPKVNWQELFRRKFNAAFNSAVRGRSTLSYKRIDRRSPGKIIFPGRISYQPRAMMGIDTSGSMDKRDYEAVLVEAEGIMKTGLRSKGSLKVFSVDTTIKGIETVKSIKDINLSGGGGTDMSVAFAYINSLSAKEKPNIFVLGTDGGTDWSPIITELRRPEATYTAIILVTTKLCYDTVPKELHDLAAVIDVSDGKNSW